MNPCFTLSNSGQFRKVAIFSGAIVALGFLSLSVSVSTAQVKYTPDHPDVLEAAKSGVQFLEKNLSNESGEAILAGWVG